MCAGRGVKHSAGRKALTFAWFLNLVSSMSRGRSLAMSSSSARIAVSSIRTCVAGCRIGERDAAAAGSSKCYGVGQTQAMIGRHVAVRI